MKENPDFKAAAEAVGDYCEENINYEDARARVIHATGAIKEEPETRFFTIGDTVDDFYGEISKGNYHSLKYVLWEFLQSESSAKIVKDEYYSSLVKYPQNEESFIEQEDEYRDNMYAAC